MFFLKYLWPDMTSRSTESELMDDFSSSYPRLIRTVKQFALINRFFTRSEYVLSKFFLSRMLNDRSKSYTFLDIGSGGGDAALFLDRECVKNNIDCKIYCLDYDKRIADYLREKFKDNDRVEVLEASFFDEFQSGKFDFVYANHLMHHLDSDVIPPALRRIESITSNCFVVNDLFRSNFAYLGYTLFAFLFLRKSFAFYDGRLSIMKGFTQSELENYTVGSNIEGLRIIHLAPARFCIIKEFDV